MASFTTHASYVNGPIVELQIGDETWNKPLYVHLKLFRRFPKVAELAGVVHDDQARVHLTHKSSFEYVLFILLISWMYDGELTQGMVEEVIAENRSKLPWDYCDFDFEGINDFEMFCCPVGQGAPVFWLLAESLELPDLQDAIMRLICLRKRATDEDTSVKELGLYYEYCKLGLDYVYANTSHGSPLRLVAIEYHGKVELCMEWVTDDTDELLTWVIAPVNALHTRQQLRDLLRRVRPVKHEGKHITTLQLGSRFEFDDNGKPFAEGEIHPDFLVDRSSNNAASTSSGSRESSPDSDMEEV